MYKIFLDQYKTFQCNIQIEGADLNKSEARLILETDLYNLSFTGKISNNGIVTIPITKLKGLIKENYTGKIRLEIIADDMIFKPWEDDYNADLSKKVQVTVNENDNINESIVQKPKMEFSIIPDEFDTKQHLKNIHEILKRNNVNKININKKQNIPIFNKLVETYCKLNHINNLQEISKIKTDLLHDINI